MGNRMIWLGLAVLVVALVASTTAFAATQRPSAGAGARAAGLGGACGALMRDPAALKDMQALRAEHQADMRAWFRQYGSDPGSTAAQAALSRLRAEHRNDMRALLQKHGAHSGGWPRGGMMGGGYGYGMMGGSSNGYGGMMGGS
jgi:hypothetical protein